MASYPNETDILGIQAALRALVAKKQPVPIETYAGHVSTLLMAADSTRAALAAPEPAKGGVADMDAGINWQGVARDATLRAEAAEAVLAEHRMLLDQASAVRTLTTDTLAALLPDCDPAMPYVAFLDKVAGQIRAIGEDAIEARAALRQGREAHRALREAARAMISESKYGPLYNTSLDKLEALRDALAALGEAPDAQ